jgi:subtilase family serine protease
MSLNRTLPHTSTRIRLSLWLAVLALMLSPVVVAAPNQGTNMGPEDESKVISVTVWLNFHNKAALDSLVQQMYDKDSPNYHHWLTMGEYKTQFAPHRKRSRRGPRFPRIPQYESQHDRPK